MVETDVSRDVGGWVVVEVDILSGDLKGWWIECLVRPLGRGRLSMPLVEFCGVEFGGVLASFDGGGDAVGSVACLISVSV